MAMNGSTGIMPVGAPGVPPGGSLGTNKVGPGETPGFDTGGAPVLR
jgi:hypothetical protein